MLMMGNETLPEHGSFRDRHGRVFYRGERVLRALSPKAWKDWEQLSKTRFFGRFQSEGHMVRTQAAPDIDAAQLGGEWAGVLEHQPIPFISYPYEWSFGMLQDGALLHLDLIRDAIQEGMILKDATSYNIQWVGSVPIFIDTASFEPLGEGSTWAGYRQFSQLFLFPLLLQSYKNLAFQPWLRGRVDGITPSDCNAVMSLRDMLRKGVLSHVYLQSKLEASLGGTRKDIRKEIQSAGFNRELILSNLKRLRKLIGNLRWKEAKSTWSDYAGDNSYTAEDQAAKQLFVGNTVARRPRALVWDLGSNTGVFSRIAAKHADYVVSMDGDHLAIERLYQALKQERVRNILPLVNNLADPSPGLGWRGRERKSLPQRGRPDLILALALIHHIVIGANIPLADFVEWLAELGSDLIIEFVTKQDPMVEALLRNKDDQYDDYSLENFEEVLKTHFSIEDRKPLDSGTRVLFYCASLDR